MTKPQTLLLGLMLVSVSTLSAASDSSVIVTPLENTDVDSDARAKLLVTLTPLKSVLQLLAVNLDPSSSYDLVAAGQVQATMMTDSMGRIRFGMSNPAAPGRRELKFDPRGTTLEIKKDGVAVFSTVVSGSGETPGATVAEKALLPRENSSKVRALTSYTLSASGGRRFSMMVPALQNGTNAEVYVDGVYAGNLKVKARTGTAVFSATPKTASEQTLDFDPRGRVVDILQNGALVYSGECEARGRGANFDKAQVVRGYIPSTGLDSDGKAKGRYRVHRDAKETFNLEVEDVPTGSYEVLVDGVQKGFVEVISGASGTEGELEFATRSDDPEKLPLDFDPLTAAFEVRLGADVYFQGTLDTNLVVPEPTDDPVAIEEYLTSTGLQPFAKAKAEFEISGAETEFSVRLEHAEPGRHAIDVAGVRRGYIDIVPDDGEDHGEGEIKFKAGDNSSSSSSDDDSDNNELPLNFEPRGELIEVINASGVVFSHVFGSGSAGGEGSSPSHIEIPLFSTGAVDGSAKMEYEQEDDGELSFEVKLRGVPEGVYNLIVAGVVQGTINVSSSDDGTRGEIRFENDDDSSNGELPLTFDPLGQIVEIEQSGVIYFQRVLDVP